MVTLGAKHSGWHAAHMHGFLAAYQVFIVSIASGFPCYKATVDSMEHASVLDAVSIETSCSISIPTPTCC